MPWFVTVPLVVTAALGVGRLAVEFGGDAIKTLVSGIKNFFSKLLGLGKEMSEPMAEQFRDRGEPTREREKGEKSQERGKEQPQPNRETNTQQQNKNNQERQNNRDNQTNREQIGDKAQNNQEEQKTRDSKKEDFNPKKEEISANIKSFMPSNWMNLSKEQKEQATQSLFDEIAKAEGLTKNYQIKFASTNQELGVTDIVDQNNRTITFDLKHLEEGSQTAIPLYNAIVKEVAYARQNEIMEGLIKPTKFEKDCMPAIALNKSDLTTKLYVSKTNFLNESLDKISANNAMSYITAKPTDSFERRAVAALQPSERFATMLNDQYFAKLESVIKDAKIPVSDQVREQMEDNQKMSYHNVVQQLKSLYNVRGSIEREIENCLLKSDPNNQSMKDTKEQKHYVNWQVLYAVGVYRMQSTKEAVGEEFADPRRDVVQNIFLNNSGEIPSMRENVYENCKGRLEFENIQVAEIIPKEPTPEKPQTKEEQGNNQPPTVDNNEQETNEETPINEENGGGEERREEERTDDENYTYFENPEGDETQTLNGEDFFEEVEI